MRIKKWIYFLPAILCMLLIFLFSATPAKESSEMSDGISLKLVKAIGELPFVNWNEEKMEDVAVVLHYPVRKVAHMSEYALLGILLAYPLELHSDKRKLVFLLALGICMLYAASDEWHQVFVPGRDGNLGDVCIDSLGASIGIFLELYIHKKWKEKRT